MVEPGEDKPSKRSAKRRRQKESKKAQEERAEQEEREVQYIEQLKGAMLKQKLRANISVKQSQRLAKNN